MELWNWSDGVVEFWSGGFRVSGVGIRKETRMKRHEVESEPQNIEQEISNDEVWIRCAQSFLKILMIEHLTSIFIIPCSIFVIRFFKVFLSIRLNVRHQLRR